MSSYRSRDMGRRDSFLTEARNVVSPPLAVACNNAALKAHFLCYNYGFNFFVIMK